METTHDLLARWNAWGDRQLWRKTLANPDAKPEHRAIAGQQLAGLESATGLDALAANAELVKLFKGWQWLAIKSAREDGATWEQVGQVLGTSKQGALNAYTRAIEHQEKYVPDLHDTAAARAVLDDGAGDRDTGMFIRALSDNAVRDVLLTLVDRRPDLVDQALADCAATWDPAGADAAAAGTES